MFSYKIEVFFDLFVIRLFTAKQKKTKKKNKVINL